MCLNQSTSFYSAFLSVISGFLLMLILKFSAALFTLFLIIHLLSTGPSTYQISCPPKAYLLFVSQVRFRKK